MACNRGHSRAADAQMRGHVCCRGQWGVGNRVAGTFNAYRGMSWWHRNRCANVRAWCLVLPFSTLLPSVLDLTCSVYHIPPRRSCPVSRSCPGGSERSDFSPIWEDILAYPRSRSTCCNAACAAAISSIDDATLSQMKTGFTVSLHCSKRV